MNSLADDVGFSSGDAVEIISGQFRGCTATIEEINGDQATVMINAMSSFTGHVSFKSSGGTRPAQFSFEISLHQVKLLN